MSVCASIVCPQCGKLYDDSPRRPCIGKCNHTICLSCKNSLESSECPICKDSDAFLKTETIFNYQTINFLTDFQKCLSENDIERFKNSLKDLGSGACSKCNSLSKKLRVCTACTPFIEKSGNGGWRPSYWLETRNASLRTKGAAICANCAIDYHDGHEIIELMAVEGIDEDFEIESILKLQYLIESNWQRDIEEGWTTMEANEPKKLALQWNLDVRMAEIRRGSYENSLELIKAPQFRKWKPLLEKSQEEVRKYQKILEDLKKCEKIRIQWSIAIGCLMKFFHFDSTEKDRKITRETAESYERMPKYHLSFEEYVYYDRFATRKLIKLTVEMAKKHPEWRNDPDHLSYLVITEQLIKVKKGIKECDRGVDEAFHNLNEHCARGVKESSDENEMQMNYAQFDAGCVQLQLKVDEANVKKLKNYANEQLANMMMVKCDVLGNPKYLMKIEELIKKYEDSPYKTDDIFDRIDNEKLPK